MAEGYTPEDFLPEDEYYDERGQTKDENIEMKNRDSWEQTPNEFAKPPEQETSLDEKLPIAPDTIEYLERDVKIKNFYKHMLKKGYTVDKNAPLMNKALYWMDDKKNFIHEL